MLIIEVLMHKEGRYYLFSLVRVEAACRVFKQGNSFLCLPGGCLPEGVRLSADQLAPEPVHLLLHPLHLGVKPEQ